MKINGQQIGIGLPTYVIAEMSANHGGKLENALELVRAAKRAGADAIKLQTYTADTLTIPSQRKWFLISGGTPWDGKTLHELYASAYTPWEWQPQLMEEAGRQGITLFSTPFDHSAVDFLEKMDVPAYKIASFEVVDIPLIKYVASKGKPMLISTGMGTESEIREALNTARTSGAKDVVLLKCTSSYPADPKDANLHAIQKMVNTFSVPIGLSDHTLSMEIPAFAVVAGACVIEKHLTLSRKMETADSGFSLEPEEFKHMVEVIRIAEKSLGTPTLGVLPSEEKSRVFRRSLFVVKNMKKGETFSNENLRSIRPGYGLPPKHFEEILGKTAAKAIEEGTPLDWEMVARD